MVALAFSTFVPETKSKYNPYKYVYSRIKYVAGNKTNIQYYVF
jgi:hypothetical protein